MINCFPSFFYQHKLVESKILYFTNIFNDQGRFLSIFSFFHLRDLINKQTKMKSTLVTYNIHERLIHYTEGLLEPGQISNMRSFCKNSLTLQTVGYLQKKKDHPRCLTTFYYAPVMCLLLWKLQNYTQIGSK